MVIGCDYDSHKATFCALQFVTQAPLIAVAEYRLAKETGPDAAIRSLDRVEDAVLVALAELRASEEQSVVWIERGYGQSRRADWILGAYFGAIWAAVAQVCLVNPLDLREWKRAVTKAAGIGLTKKGEGNGNAPKPLANEATLALLHEYALIAGDGSGRSSSAAPFGIAWTPDMLDAYAVAWTGRKLNEGALT